MSHVQFVDSHPPPVILKGVDIFLELDADIRPDSKFIIGNFDSGRSSRGSTANGITGNSTLLRCLDRFTRPERLGTNEKSYCQRCQTRQESIKQMSMVETEEMWASQSPSTEFELFAVVTHSGKLDSGHYVSFIRLSGQWYKCDDAWVTRVSEEVVRASQGCMLC